MAGLRWRGGKGGAVSRIDLTKIDWEAPLTIIHCWNVVCAANRWQKLICYVIGVRQVVAFEEYKLVW